MSDKLHFSGPSWRVQLTVFDIPALGALPPKLDFVVQKLPKEAHCSTAFSRGHQVYFGQSLDAALLVVRRWAELEPKLPKGWTKYIASRVEEKLKP